MIKYSINLQNILSYHLEKRLEDDYLAILTNCPSVNALKKYKKRWTIETFFQSIKERGFDIEQTYLDQVYSLKKLFAFVTLAFVICLSVGLNTTKMLNLLKLKIMANTPSLFFHLKFF